jgi:hypothetical protein
MEGDDVTAMNAFKSTGAIGAGRNGRNPSVEIRLRRRKNDDRRRTPEIRKIEPTH